MVEEYEGVEDAECGVVEDAGENNVFEVLQAICVMDFPLDVLVLNLDDFFKFGLVVEVLSVIGLVQGEVWVVCDMSARVV